MISIKSSLLAIAFTAWCVTANAETPEEWIALGARVHGAFGSFIPLGIKIGLDAVNRLKAKPRELTVLYYDRARTITLRVLCRRYRYCDLCVRRSAYLDHRTRKSATRNGGGYYHPPTTGRGWL